jgi:hypothetical protein
VRTFDSAIDPDRDFTHERGHDPGEAEGEPGESVTSEQSDSSTSSKVHTAFEKCLHQAARSGESPNAA